MTHDVEIHVSAHKGAASCALGTEGSILFARHLKINGEEFFTEGNVAIEIGGSEGFVYLKLERPTEEYQAWANENMISRSEHREFGYNRIREHFDDPEEYIDGTDDDVLLLGVRSLSFVEARYPVAA